MESKLYREALRFAERIHKNQARKFSGRPYIEHPISVSHILSEVSDNENLIAAGLLHDTIEDCEPYGSVTYDIIHDQFNERVADLVNAVTEQDKTQSWELRKRTAIEHIPLMDHDMQLLKSADLLDNTSDMSHGAAEFGMMYFESFTRDPHTTIGNYTRVYTTLLKTWSDNPLLPEIKEQLTTISEVLEKLSMES